MAQDDQFRRTFEILADRVLEDVSSQLKGVGNELAAAFEAERSKVIAEASIAARGEAERQAADRLAEVEHRAQETVQAAEARARDAVAAADAAAREAIAAAEVRWRDAVESADTRAKNDVAAAENRATEAIGRAEALVQEAMGTAEARTRETVTAVETRARHAVAAAENRAQDAVAAVEARARGDIDSAIARTRAEAASDAMAANERLASSVRAIDAGQSLSEIMNALIRAASAEAPRVGIFVREGALLRSWKLIGFGEGVDGQSLDLSLADAGIVADALRSAQVAMAGPTSESFAPTFAELTPERSSIAVPLVISREVIGVLYADPGVSDTPPHHAWAPTIEILGRHATRALEVLTASKLLAQTLANRQAPTTSRTGVLGLR